MRTVVFVFDCDKPFVPAFLQLHMRQLVVFHRN